MKKVSVWEFNQMMKKDSRLIINCYEYKGLIVSTTFRKGKMGMMTEIHRYIKTQYFTLWQSHHPRRIEDYQFHLSTIQTFIDSDKFDIDKRSVNAVFKQIGR